MEGAITDILPLEPVFGPPKADTSAERARSALADIAAITAPTKSQISVIQHPANLNTVLKVRAGPGSGKTSTIAGRIAYLLHTEELLPSEILVLSMANRLVNALRASIERLVGENKADQVSIATFHLFCGSLIDQYEHYFNTDASPRKLMDDLSWRHFLTFFLGKTIALNDQKVGGRVSAPVLERIIADVRSGAVSAEDAAKKAFVKKEYIEALLKYMDQNGMIRYDDLLTGALSLMELSANSADPIPQLAAYKAVVVDEFQDMHPQLMAVVDAVVLHPTFGAQPGAFKHLTVAGDANQSIYEFLGSRPELIDRVGENIDPGNIVQLDIPELFRSTEEILTAATELCLESHYMSHASPLAVRGPGHLPVVYVQNSDTEEYQFIADEITRLICELGGTLRALDFAILARTHQELDGILKYMENNYDFQFTRLALGNAWVKTKLHILPDILNIIHQGPGADFSLLCILMLLDPTTGSRQRISRLFNAAADEGQKETINRLELFLASELRATTSWPDVKASEKENTTKREEESAMKTKDSTLKECDTEKVASGKSDAAIVSSFENLQLNEVQAAKGLNQSDSVPFPQRTHPDDPEPLPGTQQKKTSFNAIPKTSPTAKLSTIYKTGSHEGVLRRFLLFLAAIQTERAALNTGPQDPNAVLTSLWQVLSVLGLLEYVNRQVGIHQNPAEYQDSLHRNLELFNKSLWYAYQKYDAQAAPEEPFVGHFLRCYNDDVPLEDKESIKLLTIHTAKGLEFPVVFVMRNASPVSRESYWSSLLAPKEPFFPTPSKARLFYVACTRARNLLYVGTSHNEDLNRSFRARFTTDLPQMSTKVAPETLFLKSLALDLDRPVPSAPRLASGQNLYRKLQKRQARLFYTASSRLVLAARTVMRR